LVLDIGIRAKHEITAICRILKLYHINAVIC